MFLGLGCVQQEHSRHGHLPFWDKGPAISQQTAQASPGVPVCLGEVGKVMSGVRDCLCQINFILFSYRVF